MRFVLAGEGRPALRVARHLAKNGWLAGWYTEQAGQPRVEELVASANAVAAPAESLRDPGAAHLEGDWLLSVNTTVIISADAIDAFSGRALNLHNGPLPAYAGRHVTQWGIRNGETRFASTIHFMEAGIDTGDIVAESWYDIGLEDTGLALFERSFKVGADLMTEVVSRLAAGEDLERRAQDLGRRHLYRHKDALDPRIDWKWTARRIADFARAGNYAPLMSPTYVATVVAPDETVQVLKAMPVAGSGAPGTVLAVDAGSMTVACGDGAVRLLDLRRDGKPIDRAPSIAVGTVLTGREEGEGEP